MSAIIFWLVLLIIFFVAVYRLARSERPGTDAFNYLALSSGWEGAVLLGLLALIRQSDKWKAELDAADEEAGRSE
jgi:hypothetical protein